MISGANLTFKLNQYYSRLILQKDRIICFTQTKELMTKFGLENTGIYRVWIPLRKQMGEEGQIFFVAGAG
jgi:hypothetical protein